VSEQIGELAALAELAELRRNQVYRGVGVEPGDGRLVLVLPGLFGNDFYLSPLRGWLKRIGYKPVRSTIALNAGCPERLTSGVQVSLARRIGQSSDPVAVIGHSRGGMLARVIAVRLGAQASHLIALGSPLGAIASMSSWGKPGSVRNAPAERRVVEAGRRALEILDPDCNVPDCGCPYPKDLRARLNPKTRFASIYSSEDQIVSPKASPVRGAENIEVKGTHSGLVYNVAVYGHLARVLAGG
jgi:pimeloyl-ACP methyl ester carboxylesterase